MIFSSTGRHAVRAFRGRTAVLLLVAAGAHAEGRLPESLQIHGFLTQGYAISNHNNYLTMNTNRGTPRLTDGGLNITWRVSSKLRVGAQAYDRYIGDLGKGRVLLDWALVDYHYKDWLGFRAGKVKTPLGLFTDSQDQEFLHTWALLPQSVYPLDLRETTNAHTGGDLYGSVNFGKTGFVSYQMYAGWLSPDYRGGYLYGIQDAGFKNVTYSAKTTGYDFRWTTPVMGLIAGASQNFGQYDFQGELVAAPIKGTARVYMGRQTALYADWTRGRWRLNGEYRASKALTRIDIAVPSLRLSGQHSRSWFTALSFRILPWLEAGTYRSQYRFTQLFNPLVGLMGPGADHIDDTTVTVRLDPNPYWNIKLEGHFIDGFGNVLSARGFYPRYHPNGFSPTTNMLVVRTAWTF